MFCVTRGRRFLHNRDEMCSKNPLVLEMEKSEQQHVTKFIVLKGLGAKAIPRELTTVLISPAYLVNHIKKSVFRFKPGEKACEEQS
jgi:hypothetical protein